MGMLSIAGCAQRRLLYFPTHQPGTAMAAEAGLTRWEIDGEYVGYKRVRQHSARVWLVFHGNGGQAAGRGYVLSRIDPADSIYVLEYPGYGERPGRPSKPAFDAAAATAYDAVVREHGRDPVIVVGESLGSGPACEVARRPNSPARLVLVVPFDVLQDVAKEKFPWLPVGLLLLDRWDNVAALKEYAGRVDVFGATRDQVIPVGHARKLAASHPGARYHEFDAGHEWPDPPTFQRGLAE